MSEMVNDNGSSMGKFFDGNVIRNESGKAAGLNWSQHVELLPEE